MNKLEYIKSLVAQGVGSKEIYGLAAEYDIQNPVKTNDTQNPDATAVSTNDDASNTDSESTDGSSDSPNAINPGQTITNNDGYEYKFEIDPNDSTKGVYYNRKVGEEEWNNASVNDGSDESLIANASIANLFGHSEFDESKRKEYFERTQENIKATEEQKKKKDDAIAEKVKKDERGFFGMLHDSMKDDAKNVVAMGASALGLTDPRTGEKFRDVTLLDAAASNAENYVGLVSYGTGEVVESILDYGLGDSNYNPLNWYKKGAEVVVNSDLVINTMDTIGFDFYRNLKEDPDYSTLRDKDGDFSFTNTIDRIVENYTGIEDYDYADETGTQVEAGILNIAAGLAAAPGWIVDQADLIDKMAIEDLGISEDALDTMETISYFTPFNVSVGLKNLSQSGGFREFAKISEEAYDTYTAEAESLNMTLSDFGDVGMFETVLEGASLEDKTFDERIGAFVTGSARITSAALGSLPSVAQSMIPYVGIASIVVGEAARANMESKKDGRPLSLERIAHSYVLGASEGLLELTTKKIGSGFLKNLGFGKATRKQIATTVTKSMLNVAKEFGQEGLSESATMIINEIADQMYKGNDRNNDGIISEEEMGLGYFPAWRELIDTFVIGGVMGGGISGAGAGANLLKQTVNRGKILADLKVEGYNSLGDAYDTSIDPTEVTSKDIEQKQASDPPSDQPNKNATKPSKKETLDDIDGENVSENQQETNTDSQVKSNKDVNENTKSNKSSKTSITQLSEESSNVTEESADIKDVQDNTVSNKDAAANAGYEIDINPNTEMFLDQELKRKVSKGTITKEKSAEIKANFKVRQEAANRIKSMGFTGATRKKVVDLLTEESKLEDVIKETDNKALTKTEQKRVNEIQQELAAIPRTSTQQAAINTEVDRDIAFTEKFGNIGKKDGEFKDFIGENKAVVTYNTTQEFMEATGSTDGNVDAFITPEGQIIINKQHMREAGAVGVGRHELLHKILKSQFSGKNGEKLKDQFLEVIKAQDPAGYKLLMDKINQIDPATGERVYSEQELKDAPDEYLAQYSSLLFEGKIPLETFVEKPTLVKKLGNFFSNIFADAANENPTGENVKASDVGFKDGKDLYDFVRAYAKDSESGKLSERSKELAEQGKDITGKKAMSKTVLESINNLVPKDINTKEEYDAFLRNPRDSKPLFDSLFNDGGAINNYVKSRTTTTAEANKALEGLQNRILNFNPDAKRKNSNKTVGSEGFGEAIFANTRFAKLDAKKSLFKEGEKAKQEKSIDDGTLQITDDTTTAKKDNTKLAKKPSETTGLDKATETRIDEAVNKNFKGDDVKFSETNNVPQEVADIYGEMFGLNPETIVSKKRNYQKTDSKGLTRAKQFLLKNAKDDYARLPKTKDGFGKSTFVPKNVTDALYTDGKLTGTLKEYMDLIREKPVKPIYRDRVGQTIRGLLNLHVRNRILETAQPSQGKRLQSGALFSKSVIDGMFDRRLKGRLKVDTLLTEAELGKSLDLKKLVLTEGGREQIVKTFKEEVFVLLPKSAWLQKDAFTSSNANFNISIKNGTKEEVAAFNQLKEDLNKEIRNTPDKEFGKPITYKDENGKTQTLTNFALSTYGTIFKGTPGEIKSKSEKFNIKTAAIHKALWDRIAARIKKDKTRAPAIATYLKLTANDKSSWHRKGAQIFGYSKNPKGVVNSKGVLILYEMEHAMPATAAYLYLLDNAIKNAGKGESSFKEAYELVIKNYKLIALDKAQNAKLGLAKLGSTMPDNWNLLENFWWQRYFNEGITKFDGGINPSSIVGLDSKNLADTFNIQADGQPTTESLIKDAKKAVALNDNTFEDVLTSDGNKTFSKTIPGQINTLTELDKKDAQERKDNLINKSKTFDRIFNDIIEESTGIESYKEYSPAKAQTVGANKGKFTFFTTPSAEDFLGLMYKLLGKGKVGDAQMAFIKTNLIDPYNRAEVTVTKALISAANDYKALKRNLKTLPKSLSKATGIGGFTFGQAARVAIWTRQGMEVPGLSKKDAKELNAFVKADPELEIFVNELIKIQKGKPYPKPGKNWLAGTIPSDIETEIKRVNRAAYMQEFTDNADIIFSDKNLAKLEAAYGPRYVEALKDQLRRMKSGSNRPIGGSRIVNNLLDWLNNSVGAIMFLNTRSAVLQTISAVNFINFSDNNIYKAGKAFANQKQYWKDFMTLFNSPYLVDRRDGLKINVSESEISDAVSESANKPKAFLNLLLSKGFVMTRIADSFAIAAGGSTFYRNRIQALIDGGMDSKAAEKQAFQDFYDISETSQQSSNAAKISQQQASGAGRIILAFANTPMQYARIIKRSTQDLINGRGDWKSNVSKIVYYSAIQNLVFNALSAALFSLAFGDDEEETEEEKQAKLDGKTGRIANGMADSLLRGLGIQGAAVAALKDALMTIYKENSKAKGSPDFAKAIYDMFGFSPPLDSKLRKLRSGANTFSWEGQRMQEEGSSLNNPAYLAGAQVVSALTNAPLDRAIQKINNLRTIFSNSSQNWQKVALAMGWSTWDLGLPYYGVEDKEVQTPQTILRDKVLKMKKETSGKEQKQMLLDLGLTKQEIVKLKYEEVRIKKIIELQNKKKDE